MSAHVMHGKVAEFTTSTLRRARHLYVDEQLSCRAVAAKLAEESPEGEPSPSHTWVYDHLGRLGVLRTKSQADVVLQSRRRGKDYAAIHEVARRLTLEHNWSTRHIARLLGVTHKSIAFAIGPDERLNARDATLRRNWHADHPDVVKRVRRRARCISMRIDGATYSEIMLALQISKPTVSAYLRGAGLTGGYKLRLR